jgi:hypothetical protein
MTSASGKNFDLSIIFSVQGADGSPTVSDRENMVGDQDICITDSAVCYGLQVTGEQEHCRARTNRLGEPAAAFFLRNILQLPKQ